MNLRRPALLGIWIAALVCGGWAAPAVGPAKEAPRQVGATDNGQPILSAELDELTRALADPHVGLLSSACDALKKDTGRTLWYRCHASLRRSAPARMSG